MQSESFFPHLNLILKGTFEPKFRGGSKPNAEVIAIRANPTAHATKIRGILDQIRFSDTELRHQRENDGLPSVPPDKGFLLKLPEGTDVEAIVRSLGVELVAETEEGLMLVSSEDISFAKIEQVLAEFETNNKKIVAASSLIDIYHQPDDLRRLEKILSPQVFAIWPLNDDRIYTFDIGIQTAASTREIAWPTVRRRNTETEEDFQKRKNDERRKALIIANDEWQEKAESRFAELGPFVEHYNGEFVSGMMNESEEIGEKGVVFSDSVQVRIRMNGAGFKDIIFNFAHLFEVSLPPKVQTVAPVQDDTENPYDVNIRNPEDNAPAVCIIDSGIQEEHRWLSPAIDRAVSRCFLPSADPDDVADYFRPSGHGTRVAGAVLYPGTIPVTGEIIPATWLQNARVLDNNCLLPESLPPELYLQQVVDHFTTPDRFTKIYNHSINDRTACNENRMTAWAAKMDQLSHERDVLFIQSAGNESRSNLQEHLNAGRLPPQHQLTETMRVANPAQSLHVLTVGSVAESFYEDEDHRSFATEEHHPSGFSRSGYSVPWNVVKPEVVEFGGDLIYEKNPPNNVKFHPEVSSELLCSTLHGSPAFSRDCAGTSFSAPKVTHIAACLQALFPNASPQLYRALIVQSARWPRWAEDSDSIDDVLRLIGYGIPSLERATNNSENRITLITPDAIVIPSKQYHLYTINIPEELRMQSLEANIRVDVTLAYTAMPRRTRARRTGYLETWLDWQSSQLGEPLSVFRDRMEIGGKSRYQGFPWKLHSQDNFGEAHETNRNRGTVQKDWAIFKAYDFPEQFAIAVRGHHGWNHLDGAGMARYCLAISFEAVDMELPVYTMIESAVEVESEILIGDRITTGVL